MKRLFASLFTLALSSHAVANHYAIVVDAGSTGSRLHIFEYEKNKKNDVPTIKDLYAEKNKQPLASFASEPQAALSSLVPLFDHAKEELEKKQIDLKKVQVSILGTAGMRLLPPETQRNIYDQLTAGFLQKYAFELKEAKTIDGKMEGVYGWLDINYLLNTFQSNSPTFGSIDVGGASLQVVYAIPNKQESPETIDLQIGKKHFKVYSKSFLGLGLDQARLAIFNDPTGIACYPKEYLLDDKGRQGRFNFNECAYSYTDLLTARHRIFSELLLPPNESFVAYSGAYYTYNFFGVDDKPSGKNLSAQIDKICNVNTWSQLKLLYPKMEEKHLSAVCANGVYMNVFFNELEAHHDAFMVTDKINKVSLDWALGALFYDLVK